MKEVLQEHGFDIDEAISSKDDNVFDDPKALFVSLAMVQCIQVWAPQSELNEWFPKQLVVNKI